MRVVISNVLKFGVLGMTLYPDHCWALNELLKPSESNADVSPISSTLAAPAITDSSGPLAFPLPSTVSVSAPVHQVVEACTDIILATLYESLTDGVSQLWAYGVEELIPLLASEEFAMREFASEALFRIGPPAREPLTEAMILDDDLEVRTRAERLLRRIDNTGYDGMFRIGVKSAIVEIDPAANQMSHLLSIQLQIESDIPGLVIRLDAVSPGAQVEEVLGDPDGEFYLSRLFKTKFKDGDSVNTILAVLEDFTVAQDSLVNHGEVLPLTYTIPVVLQTLPDCPGFEIRTVLHFEIATTQIEVRYK